MLAGFCAAFITAWLIIRLALKLVSKYGFMPFAWYRIFADIFIVLFVS